MNPTVIGIDLGTTNSLVCVMQNGRPKVLSNELGDELTPSVVATSKDGIALIGKPAKERLLTEPLAGKDRFKRDMGSDIVYNLSLIHI